MEDPIWWHKINSELEQYFKDKKRKVKTSIPYIPNYISDSRIDSNSPLFEQVWYLNKCWNLSNPDKKC